MSFTFFFILICDRNISRLSNFSLIFDLLKEVIGVGSHARSVKMSSEGDGETGSMVLEISDRLVSGMVISGQNQSKTTVRSSTLGKIHSSELTAAICCVCVPGGLQFKLL